MKSWIVALSCFLSPVALAGGYGDAGCGLGSLLFGSKKGFLQIFAATTNGTFGNQTFGITSGTSNCSGLGKEADEFIHVNKVSLQHDAAAGQGETLTSLSKMFQCEDNQKFGEVVRSNYQQIFSDLEPTLIRQRISAAVTLEGMSCALPS